MMDQHHEGHRARMRARYKAGGLTGFAPHEALELLLFYAIPRRNVNPLAHKLIAEFGSLRGVFAAPLERLRKIPGLGEGAALLLTLPQALGAFIDAEDPPRRPLMSSRLDAQRYCTRLFATAREEVLYVICLDGQGRVLKAVPAIQGTIDEISIYPRTIVSAALNNDAQSVVLSHNHPSGVAEPSRADLQTTDLLEKALMMVGIRLLDHIIYAEGVCTSIRQWRKEQQEQGIGMAERPRAADSNRARKKGQGDSGKAE
ncbi:MAG: DNA repair protein RadC [Oscillospiraceae bacterium]|jgi:DNA repair protein RadC|nr:DNA repair protein RadC [Oscillospiraceae bacterium]